MSKTEDPMDNLSEKLNNIKEDYHDGFSVVGCILAYKSDDNDGKLYMIRKDETDITYVTEIPEKCNNYVSDSMENLGKVYDSLNEVVNSSKYISLLCANVHANSIVAIYSGFISLALFALTIYFIISYRGNYNFKNIVSMVIFMIFSITMGSVKRALNKRIKELTNMKNSEEMKRFINDL